jgi:hypothetical protein
MAKCSSLFVLLSLIFAGAVAKAEDPLPHVRIADMDARFRLVGKLYQPLGALVKVQGIVFDGPSKGYEDGPNIRIQRINGVATQEDITIVLDAFGGDFGDEREDGVFLPKLEFGKSYEFEGYETGGFEGTPQEALRRARGLLQSAGFGFRHRFIAIKGEVIKPIVFAPTDFLDKQSLLQGRATSRNGRAYIAGADWLLQVDKSAPWPAHIEGKTVEGNGTPRKTPMTGEFDLEGAQTRLVKLEDQVGRKVALRGRMMPYFDCLYYRGTMIAVEGLETMPDRSKSLYADAVVVTGVLEEAMFPDINNMGMSKPQIKKQFIVRKARCEIATQLLSVERGPDE